VASDTQLYENYHKHRSEHKFVIFLNCGGNLDLSEALLDNDIEGQEDGLEDDFDDHNIELFILDSRRPIDLVNIHTEKAINVILKEDDEISNDQESIPKLHEIYRDEEDYEDSDDEDFDKESWFKNREKILRNYSRFSFYSTSITYTLFDMAYRMSKDTNELLWLAIIAIADQYHNCVITKEKYSSYMVALTAEQKRIINQMEKTNHKMSVNVLKIKDTFDLDLALYRQWSIIESLYHSPTTFIAFKLWSEKGQSKLLKFLGDMGIPLEEAKQKFSCMKNEFVEEFKSLFIDSVGKHNISNTDTVKTFVASCGFQDEILAQDVVWSLNSLLKVHLHSESISSCSNSLQSKENSGISSLNFDTENNFNQAYSCLKGLHLQALSPGIADSKTMLHAIVSTIKNAIASRDIQQIGSVLHYEMSKSNPDIESIAPFIQVFTKILRDSFIKSLSVSRRQIAIKLPMIAVLPALGDSLGGASNGNEENRQPGGDIAEEVSGTLANADERYVVYGCPPAIETSCRTIMPRALRAAAEKSNIDFDQVGFDPSVIQIDKEDKIVLIETLTAILLDSA